MTQEESNRNRDAAYALNKEQVKNKFSLAGIFKMARLIPTVEIADEITAMFRQNPGLKEKEYLSKAEAIYYEMDGPSFEEK